MKRVYLEITDACNLNCPFCTYEKGNAFMSLEEIDRYTDEIRPFCSYLYLHILGEPLMHPDFEQILDLLDQKKFRLQLVTNGTLLYRYPGLLDHPCLRKLSVSIHSCDENTEKDYFNTIGSLIEDPKDSIIELRFYDEDSLSKNVKDYRDSLIRRYGINETAKQGSFQLKENVYLYHQELFEWPKIDDPVISFEGTCHGGIDQIVINHNGDVSLCCLDPHACNLLGNLKKDSLADILSSEKYNNIISSFRNRKIVCDLCSRCSYRLRF